MKEAGWKRAFVVVSVLLVMSTLGLMAGCERSLRNQEIDTGESLQDDEERADESGEDQETEEGVEETNVVDLDISPNPVEPSSGLTVRVRTKGQTSSVEVDFRGVGGSAEPVEHWRRSSSLSLRSAGPGEWSANAVAPGHGGVYPVTVKAGDVAVSRPGWLLKVYPSGFLGQQGKDSAAEAVKAAFGKDFKGCELRGISEKPLLEDDKRDPRFHKLFMVVFFKPFEGPVLPSGEITYFYYAVKDGPEGLWRVMSGGTGP